MRDEISCAIRAVMEQYSQLTAYGFFHPLRNASFDDDRHQMFDTNFAFQVETAMEFIQRRCRPTKTLNGFSYALKHVAEAFGSVNGLASYVPNGAIIVAAAILGIRLKRIGLPPNCYLALKVREGNHGGE